MTLVTQGLGSVQSGVVVCQGYGDDWGGGPPPPPPVQQVVAHPPGIMGGGGRYDINPVPDYGMEKAIEEGEVGVLEPYFDGQGIDFRPSTRKKQEAEKGILGEDGVLDLDPLRLQELIREGREIDKRITNKLHRLDERERELEEMDARIKFDLEQLREESAVSMKEKDELLKAKAMFHGGEVVKDGETEVFPAGIDFGRMTEEKVRPKWQFDILKDALLPLAIGALIGAGITTVALMVYRKLSEGPKKKRPDGSLMDDRFDEDDI